MNNEYCTKCGNCCRNIAVDYKNKILYRDGIQTLSDDFAEFLIKTGEKDNITLCTCKFLSENICTNPNKPEICKNYPSSPFAFLPQECGYSGLIFVKYEHIKQKIRKLKEEIIEYESNLTKDKNLLRVIIRHQKYIDKYKIYGSEDW